MGSHECPHILPEGCPSLLRPFSQPQLLFPWQALEPGLASSGVFAASSMTYKRPLMLRTKPREDRASCLYLPGVALKAEIPDMVGEVVLSPLEMAMASGNPGTGHFLLPCQVSPAPLHLGPD